jgi:hypothetical protein
MTEELVQELKTELAEMKSYIQLLKSDRDEARRKEEAERWTRYVALTIVFMAVAAAFASQQQGAFSGKGIKELYQAGIEQGKATNQWSYYQSVSIKLHMYQFEKRSATDETPNKDLRTAALTAIAQPGIRPSAASDKEKSDPVAYAASLDKKIKKYTKQKDEIREEARKHDRKRDEHQDTSRQAQQHSSRLTLALAILQVAIAVGSISALAKKKPLWFVSMALATGGIFQTLNGVYLWL